MTAMLLHVAAPGYAMLGGVLGESVVGGGDLAAGGAAAGGAARPPNLRAGAPASAPSPKRTYEAEPLA